MKIKFISIILLSLLLGKSGQTLIGNSIAKRANFGEGNNPLLPIALKTLVDQECAVIFYNLDKETVKVI